jgi:hypothetical protein
MDGRRARSGSRRVRATLAAVATACVVAWPFAARPAEDGDNLFLQAKEAWRARVEAPYVQYGIRLRYDDHGRQMDTWYQAAFRGSDGALALERVHMPGDAQRTGGFALGAFGMTIFDTNPDAQVTQRLRDPAIEPAFTFGLMPSGYHSPIEVLPGDPTPEPVPGALREIGRVIAVNREYQITLAGVDHLRYGDAYHLLLTPLRDPKLNRLRELWVATETHLVLQETVAGILDTEPYASAVWTVRFVPLGGRLYIQQISTDDTLRFGERRIAAVQLDFVDYHFPESVPKFTFERWLH